MIKYYQKLLALKLAPLMEKLGLHKLFSIKYEGMGAILMFHRVIPKEDRLRVHNHLSLEITPDHLEAIIKFFIKHQYDIITLDQLDEYIKGNKKFVVFTMDDGYKDNYQYAFPVFKKYKVPFTIYLCTDFPDNKVFLWWYYLEELVLHNDNIEINGAQFTLAANSSNPLQKENVFNKIRNAINDKQLSISEFKIVIEKYQVSLPVDDSEYLLNWNEINELASDPLVTIGAHTISHQSLKQLSKDEVFRELEGSKKRIEKETGKEIRHFAYPFGSKKEVSGREIKLVTLVGFHTALTTNLGNVFKEHGSHLTNLPRITVNSQTSLSVLKMQLSGFYSLIDNNFKRVVI